MRLPRTTTLEIDTGASIDHVAGVDAGYYLSYLGGGSWHDAIPDRFEIDDVITTGDGFVDWDTNTSTGIDGIDFTTAPGAAIHADLTIDGTYDPDLVFVPSGGVTSTPGCMPIDLAPDAP